MQTILYIAISSAVSGAENSLLSLASHLDAARYRPLVVCPAQGPLTEKLQRLGIESLVLDVRGVVSINPLVAATSAAQSVEFVQSLLRLIRERDIGLIHANSYRLGLPCSVAARRAGIPVVWHARDIPLSRIKRPLVAWLAQTMADQAVAVSEAVADTVFSLRGQRIPKARVVYNGVDLKQFQHWNTPDPTIRQEFAVDGTDLLIANIGSLIPWKGQDLFLKAAARVSQAMPHARFLIVGGSISTAVQRRLPRSYRDYAAYLPRLCCELGLEEQVVLTGHRTDALSILRSLDLYVHTAVRPDPLPRILLEASASGTAIVAPNAGGVPEIVRHEETGLLVPPGDVEALAQAMLRLLQDRSERTRLGVAARRRVEETFTIQQHVRRMEQIYDDVLAAKEKP